MKQIRILSTFYDAGRPKYLAGALYPITDDTLREVAKGNGEEVDEPTEDELAAAKAQAEANERAAAEAQAAADAAAAQAAAAQQPAATSDAALAAAQATAPAPAAPTPARKRAGG